MFVRNENNDKIAVTHQRRPSDKKQFYITRSLIDSTYRAEYSDDIYFSVPATIWDVVSKKGNERLFFDLCDNYLN